MKTKHMMSILLCCVMGFTACKKEIIDTPPQLQLHVFNEAGNSVSNANVSLYLSEEDWENKSGTITTAITTNEGTVLFENLEEQVYYFWVEKGELNNNYTIAATGKPLAINTIAKVKVEIKAGGE